MSPTHFPVFYASTEHLRFVVPRPAHRTSLRAMGFGQIAASTQFYLFGRKHCTATGYKKAAAQYGNGVDLQQLSLTGKTFAVTGANSGVGFTLSQYLASRGASLLMVCRSQARGEAACKSIIEETGNDKVSVIVADMSLKSDARSCADEIARRCPSGLDGLVCNAGVLLNAREETSEGVEVTFATHLVFGVYMLTRLLLPTLRKAPDARVVFVSSGGMYNHNWPGAARAGSTDGHPYDGNMAYVYAKRGQVLLAEQFSSKVPGIPFVSCHPGWTDTPAVEQAYGKSKKLLEPMRTPWQGTEGIAWLCACDRSKLQGGAFYLDRKPQVKHLAGAFFSEGSFTKNTPAEINEMMLTLQTMSGLEALE